MAAIVTKDSLKALLTSANYIKRRHIVGRALCVIYANQEADEKEFETVVHYNGTGFVPCDAKAGSLGANEYLAKGTITDRLVEFWLTQDFTGYPRICKYHRQLNEAAMRKELEKL